jgi:hypothetical protein
MQCVQALTELVIDTSALVHEVQRERGLSAGFLGSKGTVRRPQTEDPRPQLTPGEAACRTEKHLAILGIALAV